MQKDELDRVLRISPHFTIFHHASLEATFLVAEREHHVVRGADVAAVIGALDGVRSVEQVIHVCGATLPPLRVLEIVSQLEVRGFATEVFAAGPEMTPERAAFEAALPLPRAATDVELIDVTESLHSAAVHAMTSALRGAGFEPGTGRGLRILVATDYIAPACADRASDALRAGSACFLVKLSGLRPFIGPYFKGAPGQPCPHCLAHALREQRPVEQFLERSAAGQGRPAAPDAALPASLAAAANLAAIHLRRILAHPEPASLSGRLWTLDYPSFGLVEHRVRHRPQCPACGDPALQAKIGGRPVALAEVPIEFALDGGFRREPPAESYARLRHLVSPILGPVSYLEPMLGRHSEAHPVFCSGYLVVPARGGSTNVFDRRCAGKGTTVEQARMSALSEAIERRSGVYRGDEAVLHATLEELGGEAIAPADLHLFSPTRQCDRDPAPLPLDYRTRIAWTPAWSLAEGRRRYVPLAFCYTEAPVDCGALYCRPSSNGSAAGNCLEEAILQGLFELVERDAVAIWWYNRLRRPPAPVPPSSAAAFAEQHEDCARHGFSQWALDLTHDIGLPVVVAVAVHNASGRPALGFGCHSDPDLALRRALSELYQVLDFDGIVASPWDGMSVSRLEHLRPDPSAPAAPPAPAITSHDLKVHVETWVGRLRELGLDTLVVDKTRPDFGLHVAQVIVPGLRHVWPRFAPGRLYNVPVALGWLPGPFTEDELSPEPLLV